MVGVLDLNDIRADLGLFGSFSGRNVGYFGETAVFLFLSAFKTVLFSSTVIRHALWAV